jgi:outer membrane protein assembly factor BamB
LWTTDLTHLGQNIWTVSYGAHAKLVYALAEYGGLAALDPSTGHIVWQTQIGNIIRGVLHEEPNKGIPVLVISGRVGLNAKTGATLWNSTSLFHVTPGTPTSNGASREETDVRVNRGKIISYNVATGKTQWTSSAQLLNTVCGASMSPKGDIVAVSTTAAGPASHPPSELILLNGTDGTLLQRQSLGSQYACSGGPAIVESKGIVLVPTYQGDGVSPMNTGALMAFDSSSSKRIWSANTRLVVILIIFVPTRTRRIRSYYDSAIFVYSMELHTY